MIKFSLQKSIFVFFLYNYFISALIIEIRKYWATEIGGVLCKVKVQDVFT